MKEWLNLPLRSKKNLLTTALLVFSCHLGIDIYTPSLPHMVKLFNSTENTLQLAITTYILGSGFAIIFWGPLSNRFGRKPILAAGAGIVIVSAIATMFCTKIETFLFMRFLQGIGSGAAMCLSRVVAADTLNKHELAVIGATMGLITGSAPLIAPIIGGYMEIYTGWQGSFAVYAAISLFTLIIFMLTFVESNTQLTTEITFLEPYYKLMRNEAFIKLAILQGLILSILNCYAAVAPFLVQIEMDQTPVYFGWLSGFCAGCQLFTKVVAPFFIRRYSSFKVHQAGWYLLSMSALLLIFRMVVPIEAITLYNIEIDPLFVIGIGTAFFSIHLTFPFVFSEALSLEHLSVGIISSGLTASGMLISFVLSSIVAGIPYEGTGLLAITYLSLGVAGLIISKSAYKTLLEI